jgi:predicted secreted hydrolase
MGVAIQTDVTGDLRHTQHSPREGNFVPTSSLVKSRRLRGVTIAGAAAVALAVVIPQASPAAAGHGGTATASQRTAVTASRVPTFVNLPADQAAHPSAVTEWWYTVGHVWAHGHEYGYEVALTNSGVSEVAITDVPAGKYYSQQVAYRAWEFSLSSTTLDVRIPNATLSGPMNAMHLTATLPEGSLDLQLNAEGAVMYDLGTGLFPFLAGSSYYYSLPSLQTSRPLTLNGTTSEVTGKSWLDRQWGTWDWTQPIKWTWMAVQLDNGDSISLWDLFSKQGKDLWATVLHRDGSESVVSITPLAKDATGFQTSPTSGQRYAGKWTVEIPSLKTRLTVTATPTLQEFGPFRPTRRNRLHRGGHLPGRAHHGQGLRRAVGRLEVSKPGPPARRRRTSPAGGPARGHSAGDTTSSLTRWKRT